MIQGFAKILLKLIGWKVEGNIPPMSKYVLIGAPHTSNWDLFYALLSLSSLGLKFNWVMKHTLFFWPLGTFFRAIGGVPVNRKSSTSFLRSVIDIFNERQQFILTISPEGTRSKTQFWKTGFYTIAIKAKVPVVMGYIDYPSKTVGVNVDANSMFTPSGNLAEDMKLIAAFYQGKRGKYIEKQGPVAIKGKS